MTDSNTDLQEETPVEPVSDGVADDVLDKATVSKIVARERQKSFIEKGKQEALMQNEQQNQAQTQSAPQPATQTFGVDATGSTDES